MKSVLLLPDKNKTIPYSNKNNCVNPTQPNSTFIPDTNSLSASLKSNGARATSAKQERNHKTKIGVNKIFIFTSFEKAKF